MGLSSYGLGLCLTPSLPLFKFILMLSSTSLFLHLNAGQQSLHIDVKKTSFYRFYHYYVNSLAEVMKYLEKVRTETSSDRLNKQVAICSLI